MVPSTLSTYRKLVQSQYAWGLLGVVVLAFTLAVAATNLQAIYQAQKDFIVGSLLSLTGFCFGKALSRTKEQRALELIQTAPTEAVAAALRIDRRVSLHNDGVFQRLSLLARDLEAATARISEYYDTEARRPYFYRSLPLLRVALEDLDRANANIIDVEQILGAAVESPAYVIVPHRATFADINTPRPAGITRAPGPSL
jgi:hypothetical protein